MFPILTSPLPSVWTKYSPAAPLASGGASILILNNPYPGSKLAIPVKLVLLCKSLLKLPKVVILPTELTSMFVAADKNPSPISFGAFLLSKPFSN